MKRIYTEFSTLGDLLIKAADRFSNNDMIIFPERRVTYAEMREMAYSRARGLVGIGLGPGSHVGILMANCIEYVECLMAIQLIGGMAVPINARYKSSELAYVLENADIDLVVTHDRISEYANFAQLLNDALAERRGPRLKHLVMLGKPSEGFLDDVDLTKIKKFENGIIEKIKSEKPEIIDAIQTSGKLEENTEKLLVQAIEEYKKANK